MGPPPMGPPMGPPMMPGPIYTPPVTNDGKAVASLVLGILSMVCCMGALTGIPAIILGALSKRDISRSGGALGGEGLAIAGMITGGLSTLGTIAYAIFYIALIGTAVATSPSYPTYAPPPPAYYPPPTPTTTSTATSGGTYTPIPTPGAIRVTDLKHSGGSLRTQIAIEFASAKEHGDKMLVITTQEDCASCDEVFATFPDPMMQRVLADVSVVRVDVDEFRNDLAGMSMDKPGLPWFFVFDDTMTIVDSISGDEWADNTAENVAPVLEKFLKGTYKKHGTGGVLPSPSAKPKAPVKHDEVF